MSPYAQVLDLVIKIDGASPYALILLLPVSIAIGWAVLILMARGR